ncbi:MAG: hypothetical protein HDS41_02890 [Bacteroides sp.]|nr:hypothetical protein [Bacteroides sp.]
MARHVTKRCPLPQPPMTQSRPAPSPSSSPPRGCGDKPSAAKRQLPPQRAAARTTPDRTQARHAKTAAKAP